MSKSPGPSGVGMPPNAKVASPPPPPPNKTDPFSSSLDDLVDKFLSGPSVRTQQMIAPLLRPPPLIGDEPIQTLRTLVERRAWGDVLQVSNDLLRGMDSAYAATYNSLLFSGAAPSGSIKEETAEIMALHCHALIKLRRYTELGKEIEKWKFLHFNEGYRPEDESINWESIKWVPWSLYIIGSESLLYTTDDPNRGADALNALATRMDEESDDARWKLCTYRALANAFSRKREWRLAIQALEHMLPEIETAVKQETTTIITNTKTLAMAYRVEVLSVQGRYLLHAGAVAEASYIFQVAQQDWDTVKANNNVDNNETNIAVAHAPAQLLANEGLLCFAYANYEQAIECFRKATDILRKYSVVPVYRSTDWIGPSVVGVAPHSTLLNECVNNLAICALYIGRMAEAVNVLETLVREDPTAFLTERVAFNLCTMYELGCDSTASALKKRVLQCISKRFFLHDVGPESFRIN